MNRNNLLNVKDRDGNLPESILTSITNTILIDPPGNDIAGGIYPFCETPHDCKKVAHGPQADNNFDESVNNNSSCNINGKMAKPAAESSKLNPISAPKGDRSKAEPLNVTKNFGLTLDDFELLTLDDLSLDDECSWLYKLQQKQPNQSISPYEWVRYEFDNWTLGGPEFSLLQTLRTISPNQRTPQKNTRTLLRLNHSILSNKKVEPTKSGSKESTPVSQKEGRTPLNSKTYNKNQLLQLVSRVQRLDSPGDAVSSGAIRQSGGEGMSDGRMVIEDGSRGRSLEDNLNDVGKQKVVDVMDVQMLAKMQEDSLRKSFSSSAQRSLNKSTGHLLDSVGQGSPLHRSTHSSPGRTYGLKEYNKSRNSLTSTSSESFSPSGSLTDVSQPVANGKSTSLNTAHKRSLPNISKNPRPDRVASAEQQRSGRDSTTPSDESSDTPSTQCSQPARHSRLKRPATKVVLPASNRSQDAASCASTLTTTASVPKSGIPMPKATSAIPRPNAGSKLRMPSKIAVARREVGVPVRNESSWREGCF